MIVLQVNGETKKVADNSTVADALSEWQYCCDAIAIAINGEFVPRSTYAQHTLAQNDCLEIVAPVQGG